MCSFADLLALERRRVLLLFCHLPADVWRTDVPPVVEPSHSQILHSAVVCFKEVDVVAEWSCSEQNFHTGSGGTSAGLMERNVDCQ